MKPLILVADLPCPRLQLRWEITSREKRERICYYEMIIPLGEWDVRREQKDGTKTPFLTLPMGHTLVSGGPEECPMENGEIETPFRDHSHILWDSASLGLPAFVIFKQYAMRVTNKNPYKKQDWVFERSSGYAGYRCQVCARWVYMGAPLVCDCDGKDKQG